MPAPSLPYLVRRGDSWCFRITVPPDLRPLLACTAITRSLGKVSRLDAAARSLALAQRLRTEFARARQLMPTDDNHRLKHLIETQRRIAYLREELDEAREAASTARSERFRAEREAQALAEAAARKARVEMLEAMQAVPQQSGHAPPPAAGSMTHPTMVEVIDQFLSAMGAQGETPMLTKHRTCLPMLRDMVGGLRTSEVKQAHLNEFFNLILQLPPNWKKRPDLLKTGWVAVAQGNTGDVSKRLATPS